ncbi:MAG: hypothetical protein AB7P04_13460 [Bacteriovoracia bacterium]
MSIYTVEMDRKGLVQKIKGALSKKVLIIAGVAVLALGGGAFFLKKGAKTSAHGDAHGGHAKADAKTGHAPAGHGDEHGDGHAPAGFGKFTAVYRDAWNSMQDKVDELKRAHSENERLRVENMNLKRWAESLRFDCSAKTAADRTHKNGTQLKEETGTETGRVLAGIQYRPPHHLLPAQMFTLAVSYMKAKEDEKAAVLLTFLTGMEENESFRTAKYYLMTGVAWYRLSHFKLADQYFEKALASGPKEKKALSYVAHARLWRALTAERLGQHTIAQNWLKDLIDHHPHSTEAAWVNSGGVLRSIASEADPEEIPVEPEDADAAEHGAAVDHAPASASRAAASMGGVQHAENAHTEANDAAEAADDHDEHGAAETKEEGSGHDHGHGH